MEGEAGGAALAEEDAEPCSRSRCPSGLCGRWPRCRASVQFGN